MPEPGKSGRRELAILSAAAAVGAGLIAGGWIIQGRGYIPAVLLQVGSSLVLVVPLLFLGRLMEARLRRTEERTKAISANLTAIGARVDEAATRLDELDALSRQDSARQLAVDLQAVDNAEKQFSRSVLADLTERAISRRAIATGGVRTQVPGTEYWLRLRADTTGAGGPALSCSLERRDATNAVTVTWAEGQASAAISARLAEELTARHAYTDQDAFNASAVFRELLNTIRTGLQHQAPEARKLAPLIELPNNQWAITVDGLDSLGQQYHIPASRLTDTNEDWSSYMTGLPWVDHDKFMEAYRTATELYRTPAAHS